MNPIAAWHDEHASFLQMLGQLQRELDVFHGAERPNYELMLEVIRRLRELGDRQQEEDVLPRAAVALTPADWRAVAAAGPASLQQ